MLLLFQRLSWAIRFSANLQRAMATWVFIIAQAALREIIIPLLLSVIYWQKNI